MVIYLLETHKYDDVEISFKALKLKSQSEIGLQNYK